MNHCTQPIPRSFDEAIHLLLIEDNPTDVLIVEEALRDVPDVEFLVTAVSRLDAGLKQLLLQPFAAIVLDLNLPDSRGEATVDRLRRKSPDIPTIVLTGDTDYTVISRILRMGVQDYLHKAPNIGPALSRSVRFAIERQRFISEQERRRRELQESEARLRTIIEALADAVVIVSQDGLVRFANLAASRLFGRDVADLLDRPFGFPVTRNATAEVDVCRRDGTTCIAEMRVVETVWEGNPAYLSSLHDITHRKQMEESLKQHQERLTHIAYHDALTGLPNRVLLDDRLRQGVALAKRNGGILAVAYMDLDGFKPINDTYGHKVGDRVLMEVSRRICCVLRASDTVARIGGDEFVLLLAGQSGTQEVVPILQRLLREIGAPLQIEDQHLALSASIGISMYPLDGNDPDILIRNADQTMYIAKRSGRNRFIFFDRDQVDGNKARSALARELHDALERDLFSVVYQPIVDLVSGHVLEAEALVRWTHPEFGPVPPSEFIPLAEDTGLIGAIGDAVLKKALRVAGKWNRRSSLSGNAIIRRVAVNWSPRQFLVGRSGEEWAALLRDAGVSGDMLSIEITEGLLLDHNSEVMAQIAQMRDLGITLALDDFGTGYSALSYLKKFPIDFLKIDRSFVSDMDKDESDRTIVESIIAMARRLGIKLIAEGVESRQQIHLLAVAGCDMAQGFFLARPMPEREFFDFVDAAGPLDPRVRRECDAHGQRSGFEGFTECPKEGLFCSDDDIPCMSPSDIV